MARRSTHVPPMAKVIAVTSGLVIDAGGSLLVALVIVETEKVSVAAAEKGRWEENVTVIT